MNKPEKHALLIGCNYTSVPNMSLQGCIHDIVNVQNMLIDAYNYAPVNITCLRDDIKTALPTRANIIAELTTIIAKSGSYSEIWIHYSGHGTQVTQKIGSSSVLDDCIVPLDCMAKGFIMKEDIFAIIKNVKCPMYIMFDSCHSGTISDLEYSIQYQTPDTFTRIHNNNLVVNNPNIVSISACKDTQTSADVYDAWNAETEGAFTNCFITCLRKSRHNISILNVYRNTCMLLAQRGFTQVPVLSSSVPIPTAYLLRD